MFFEILKALASAGGKWLFAFGLWVALLAFCGNENIAVEGDFPASVVKVFTSGMWILCAIMGLITAGLASSNTGSPPNMRFNVRM